MALTGARRAQIWIERISLWNELRMDRIREREPGLDEAGIRRLWLEETYPGELSAEYLDRVEASMRAGEVRGSRPGIRHRHLAAR